jgi:CubicO group peptidase (beta-lactamase class C family)
MSPSASAQQRQVDALLALFARQQKAGLFPGGQLVVSRQHEILAETSVGIARGLRDGEGTGAGARPPVTPETRFQVMSASKAVVGFAVALLEDRGLVDVAAPVARYFPAFAANGKEAITLLDVLTHRSGLLAEAQVQNLELWSDWDALMAAIAAARPERPRGTLSYESHAFGWICAEIVRLVTGRSLPEFLGEELGGDLAGLDFMMGTLEGFPNPPAMGSGGGPAYAPRVMAAPGASPAAHTYWLGRASYRLGGVDLPPTFEHANNEISSRRALVPGGGMLTTARALAAFYEMLLAGGVVRSGRRLIREEMLRRYITLQTSGIERLTGAYLRLGRGFALGWPLPHVYGWWGSSRCFGHAGGFSCVAFADPEAAVAVAILTNGNRSLPDMVRRFAPLASRARRL